jgi:hypothetical protein
MHINGIWIETDLMPFISLFDAIALGDDLYQHFDGIVKDDLERNDTPEYKSSEDNMNKICGKLKSEFGRGQSNVS